MANSIQAWKKDSQADPFTALQSEMNRMFEQFNKDFQLAPLDAGALAKWSPKVNVAETEKEIQVTAELPGVEEKDVEVTIDGNALTIKGEKKAEKEEKNKDYHRIERSYGSFQRSFGLPKEVEQDKVEASFKNGVLTVKLPKTWEAQQTAKKVPVKNG
jgi:HSP20 family protein